MGQHFAQLLFDVGGLFVLGAFIASNVHLALLVDSKTATRALAIPNVIVNLAFGAAIATAYFYSFIPTNFINTFSVDLALITAGTLFLSSLDLCLRKNEGALGSDWMGILILAGLVSGGPILM